MPQQLSLNLGLDVVPLSKDPDNLGDIYRLYNAVKLLAAALDAYTGILGALTEDYATAGSDFILTQNSARLYTQFAATVTAGQLIKITAAGKADLGVAGNVIGWAPAAVAINDYGEVRLLGLDTAIAGLTPGVTYYASAGTPGAITAAVTAQSIGFAISASQLFFNPRYS
jgi:hypothetical protein